MTERTDVGGASIDGLIGLMEQGHLRSRELVELCLGRIDAFDQAGPALNAIATVDPRALDDADDRDRALERDGRPTGPLHGIPVVIKDQVETAGLRTTFGSSGFSEYV